MRHAVLIALAFAAPACAQVERAGSLYLTVQDAIALAAENHFGLRVARLDPLIARAQLQRAQAGGPLRGVTSGNSQIGAAAAGQGVAGSQSSAGVSTGTGGGSSGSSGVVSQIGPVTANLDPVVQHTSLVSHTTHPQANTIQSQTAALASVQRVFNTSVQQGLISGGLVRVRFNESYLKENTPTDILNPSVAPRLNFYFQHNLLAGAGIAVNSRSITIAARNREVSEIALSQQLAAVAADVLARYWSLAAAQELSMAREHALAIATRFYDDTVKQIALGVVAKADLHRAQLEVSLRREAHMAALASVRLEQTAFGMLLGKPDTSIVTLDKIEVPEDEPLPATPRLVEQALAQRPDVRIAEMQLENARTSALGTASGILPNLGFAVETYHSGLAGVPQPYQGIGPDTRVVGGLGTALGQIVRRDYASNRVQVLMQASIGNRISQGDYGIDRLQLRQQELALRRDRNRTGAEIANLAVALGQTRARYQAARETRALNEQLRERMAESYRIGGATLNEVIAAQRNLVSAEASEITARSSYARVRVALDEALGETLTRNRVSLGPAQTPR